MTIIQVPDGGDMMGCSVESAHRDVMHQSQLDPNAWKLLTKKFCVSGNIHGQLYRNVGQCSSHEKQEQSATATYPSVEFKPV